MHCLTNLKEYGTETNKQKISTELEQFMHSSQTDRLQGRDEDVILSRQNFLRLESHRFMSYNMHICYQGLISLTNFLSPFCSQFLLYTKKKKRKTSSKITNYYSQFHIQIFSCILIIFLWSAWCWPLNLHSFFSGFVLWRKSNMGSSLFLFSQNELLRRGQNVFSLIFFYSSYSVWG